MIRYQSTLNHKLFCSLMIFILLFFVSKNAFSAKDYGVERIRSCDEFSGKVEDFDTTLLGAKESEFVATNPHCSAELLAIYAGFKLTITAMNAACRTGSLVPRVQPSFLEDAKDIAMASTKALGGDKACIKGLAAATSFYSTAAVATFGTIMEVAKLYYNNISVCGANWYSPNPKSYLIDGDGYKAEVDKQIKTWIEGVRNDKLNENEKVYREWINGGVEFESDTCEDPIRGNGEKQRYYFRGLSQANYQCEKYNPLYATSDKKDSYKKAYKCCLDKRENYICLSKNNTLPSIINIPASVQAKKITTYDHIFCKGGTTCEIDGVVKFQTEFRDNNRLICVNTYSFCPYNFSIGGGTTYPDFFKDGVYDSKNGYEFIKDVEEAKKNKSCSEKSEIRDDQCKYKVNAGRLKNYCQYYRHCTLIFDKPYVNDFNVLNPYFSRACLDFKGDSKNGYSFDGGPLFGKAVNFTAPIAQCFRETLENVFFNKAGHTRCSDGSISFNDECKSYVGSSSDPKNAIDSYLRIGDFEFKKGNQVNKESFFSSLQNKMRYLIKFILIFSILFYGFNILQGKVELTKRKDIIVYILKMGLVAYFSLGTAWQSKFFDGVYGTSAELSKLFFKVRVDSFSTGASTYGSTKMDGCQFGKIYDKSGKSMVYANRKYPADKEYLMIWDTLDCKIMKYLGYGPKATVASFATLIIASLITGGIGLYFAMSILIFAMIFIALTIRAIHLFVSSGLAIIVYVFVSPLIIPLVLFEKTKNIFESWLTHLIGFCFQPIILFAFLGIFITLTDKVLIGDARYINGDPNNFGYSQIECSSYCINESGQSVNCSPGQVPQVNPYDTSMSCILGFNDFGKSPGFELFGITLINAKNLSDNFDVRMITVIKCALLIFILAKFMDEIPSITSQLIMEIMNARSSSSSMLQKVSRTTRNIQKRLGRGLKNLSASGFSAGYSATKRGAGYLGNVKNQQSEKRSDIAGSGASENVVDMAGSSKSNKIEGADLAAESTKSTDSKPTTSEPE